MIQLLTVTVSVTVSVTVTVTVPSNCFAWKRVLFHLYSRCITSTMFINNKALLFFLLCLWFYLEAVCKVTESQTAMQKTMWPNNWQMLQNEKMEWRTKVSRIGLMRRSWWKFNLAIESWTAIFLKVYIQKFNIKLISPKP